MLIYLFRLSLMFVLWDKILAEFVGHCLALSPEKAMHTKGAFGVNARCNDF